LRKLQQVLPLIMHVQCKIIRMWSVPLLRYSHGALV